MTLFWKIIGSALITVILCIQIGQEEKTFSILLCVAMCCMGAVGALSFLDPVLELLQEIEVLAEVRSETLRTLFKCTGIALVSELAALICRDCGSNSLERILHLVGSAVIAYLSIPMILEYVNLIQGIFGDL